MRFLKASPSKWLCYSFYHLFQTLNVVKIKSQNSKKPALTITLNQKIIQNIRLFTPHISPDTSFPTRQPSHFKNFCKNFYSLLKKSKKIHKYHATIYHKALQPVKICNLQQKVLLFFAKKRYY